MAGAYKFILHGWGFFCALGFFAVAQAKVTTSEGRHFEIAGLDRASVRFVEELSERVLLEAERYLGEQPSSFPQRILVTLRPANDSADATDYGILIEPGGFVRVDFNWRKNLGYPDLCRGLVDAYLARYAIFHYGYDAPDKIKGWVVSALASQTYLSLRPAVYLGWQESLSKGETPPLPSLLVTARDVRAEGMGLSPFLMFMAMREDDFSREMVRSLFRTGVAGGDVSGLLKDSIQQTVPGVETVELQDWWEENMAELFFAPAVRFGALEDSERWVRELSGIEDFVNVGMKVGNLRDLWSLRGEEDLRSIVEVRMGRIVAGIDRVNPVFRNCTQSLGLLYERLLEGEREHTYIFALTSFLGDFSQASRLREDVEAALDGQVSP